MPSDPFSRPGFVDLVDLEAAAKELLDPPVYDYFSGGADDEITVEANIAAWKRRTFHPHVLRDVSSVTTEVDLFGASHDSPMMVAPMGYQKLAHDEGEMAMVRGAAEAGVSMCVSTMANISLEDVIAAVPGAPLWFQLYIHRDRDLTESLVRRAVAAGYRALVVTVDVPVLARRRRDERNRFTLPPGLVTANTELGMPETEGSGLLGYAAAEFEPALGPDTIEWVRALSDLPLLVKGILRGDDADLAVRAGFDGIVVSNHGGRQLDTSVASADALPEVVEAVARRVPVIVDGGVRSGADVVKAVAMGAGAVLVGRPLLWALTVRGAEGVTALLRQLRSEVERAMALVGARTVHELTEDLVT